MELQLVSFELAKKLKEIGFCGLVGHWYSRKGVLNISMVGDNPKVRSLSNYKNSAALAAPTLELAKQWFRCNHNIIISIFPELTAFTQIFRVKIFKIAAFGVYFNYQKIIRYKFSTYEAALEAGLLKACELIT